MDATHLTDRINVEAILEFFRFARRLALEEFVTQLRLRIESNSMFLKSASASQAVFAKPRGLPLLSRPTSPPADRNAS